MNSPTSCSKNIKTIHLENYDGFAFEELCAEILGRAGYGSAKTTPKTGDGGKDIVLRSQNGETIFVECKHHPNQIIGRPVVQKLHSAMVTSDVRRGMIITTGRFSQDALNYVNKHYLEIQLVDFTILCSIAHRAQIRLFLNGQSKILMMYPLPDTEYVRSRLTHHLESHYICYPSSIADLLNFSQWHVIFHPLYELNYDVDAVFSTSTKLIVHHEKAEKRFLCVDGATGQEYTHPIYKKFSHVHPQPFNADIHGWQTAVGVYNIDATTLTKVAYENIINHHSTSVTYTSKNNRSYSKSCIPSKHDCQIYNVQQTYLPQMQTHLQIKQAEYQLHQIYYSPDKLSFTPALSKCKICGKRVEQGYICNDCGSIVHQQSFLDSHGFVCKMCSKTLCRDCTYTMGLRSYVCKQCAERSGKPYKHVPASMAERYIAAGGALIIALVVSLFATVIAGAAVAIVLLLFVFKESFASSVHEDELDEI